MWPTLAVQEASRRALEDAGISVQKATRGTFTLAHADTRITFSTGTKPGGEVSDFILGCTTAIRDNVARAQVRAADKLCHRIDHMTVALSSIHTADREFGERLEKLLGASSRGTVLNGSSSIRMPSGREVTSAATRKVDEPLLSSFRLAILCPRKPRKVPSSMEVWESYRGAKSSRLFTAATLELQCDEYVEAAKERRSSPPRGHGARQVELGKWILGCEAIAATEAPDEHGLSEAKRQVAAKLAVEVGGLLVDEYGVYDASWNVVLAPWVTKLAPMPPGDVD